MKKVLIFELVLAALLVGCGNANTTSQLEEAYNRGYEIGSSEGYEEGYEYGYNMGYDEGEDEGYNEGYSECEVEMFENAADAMKNDEWDSVPDQAFLDIYDYIDGDEEISKEEAENAVDALYRFVAEVQFHK